MKFGRGRGSRTEGLSLSLLNGSLVKWQVPSFYKQEENTSDEVQNSRKYFSPNSKTYVNFDDLDRYEDGGRRIPGTGDRDELKCDGTLTRRGNQTILVDEVA